MTQTEKKKRRLTKEDIQEMRKKDHQIVRGVFKFYEVPGGNITFSFKKYPGDSIKTYTFHDGRTYDIPLMVANHINETCYTIQHEYAIASKNEPFVLPGQKMTRCCFISQDLQFVEKAG